MVHNQSRCAGGAVNRLKTGIQDAHDAFAARQAAAAGAGPALDLTMPARHDWREESDKRAGRWVCTESGPGHSQVALQDVSRHAQPLLHVGGLGLNR